MVNYRYTADDPEGRRIDGHVDAESVQEARRLLEQEGFRVLEVMETEPASLEAAPEDSGDAAPAGRLSRDDAQELAENVAQLSVAGLPLSPGLRAAGDESDSPSLAQAFYYRPKRSTTWPINSTRVGRWMTFWSLPRSSCRLTSVV